MDEIGNTISENWARAVVRYGTLPAVHDYVTGLTYSYAQLDAVVQIAAQRLHARLLGGGIAADDTEEQEVGLVLCVAEGPAMVALVLACAVASVFYVPVELAKTPPRRVNFTTADCGARALVAWRNDLPTHLPSDVALLAAEDILAGCLGLPPLPGAAALASPSWRAPTTVQPSRALYAIYTSGSTGQPKGVLIEHGNMVAFAIAKARDERIGPGARVLLASTFTFDLCEVRTRAPFNIYIYILGF
jgi:acyl-CoA synthetase (AMP-forming)/AMP-acid ligase II